MSAAGETVRLRRLIWRHEHGRVSFDRARVEAVDEEYGRAVEALHGLDGDRAVVRAHAPALLPDYEDGLHATRRALDERALRRAVDHLIHLRDLRGRMREVLEAAAAVRRAGAAVDRLRTAVFHPVLRALPCVQAPVRLLDAARLRMAEGAWTRAAYLALACIRQADAVASGGPSVAPAAVGDALAALRSLGAATRALLPDPTADLCGDAVLDAAAALAGDGWSRLAERVAEELTALQAPRARFRLAWEQDPDGCGGAVDELRRGLAAGDADPWTPALRLLWRARVDDGLRRMRGGQARLEDLRAGRDPAPGPDGFDGLSTP